MELLSGMLIVRAGYDQSGCHSASAVFKYGEGVRRGVGSVVIALDCSDCDLVGWLVDG